MPSTTRLLISLRFPVLRTVRVRGVVCISSIPGVSLRSTLGYYSRYAYPCFARPVREVGCVYLLSGGIATLNPRLLIRYAFTCFARPEREVGCAYLLYPGGIGLKPSTTRLFISLRFHVLRTVGGRGVCISPSPEVSSDALNHTVTHIAALSRASHGSLTSICVDEVGVVVVIDVKYIALLLFY